MCNNPNGFNNFFGGFFWFLFAIVISIMIFWQTLLVLIFPIRFNVFILLVELLLLFFIIYRIVWPH